MKLILSSDVCNDNSSRAIKKYLRTDAICVKCGAIFNNFYEDDCIICDDNEHDKFCDHSEFVTGRQCVDLRNMLDLQLEELSFINSLQGYTNSSRNRMVINVLKNKYKILDKRIDKSLIKKVIRRNKRKFWYMKNVESDMRKISMPNIDIIKEVDCIIN